VLFGSFFHLQVSREKLPKRHSYEKCARKTLMKLTAGYAIEDIVISDESLLLSTKDGATLTAT
jgi:hypothetical protein